ncbi:MAG: hypothetical protein RL189_2672 [Pseudomonadota bacterium]|jgi:long-chain fatty acid transport protein
MNQLQFRNFHYSLFATLAALMPAPLSAGPYNFSDVLVGDRAMGMGGAFTGVADDASALYYNPAGLGYATSSSLSAAVNAFQYTRKEYEKLFAGKDSFVEESQDLIPSFTGGVIDLNRVSEGLRGAFNLQNQTQQSSNQNDFIRRPDLNVEFLHRAQKNQLSELVYCAGAGKRISPSMALGFSVGGRQLSFDQIQYQDVVEKTPLVSVKLTDAVAANKTLYSSRSLKERGSASALAVEAGAGVMWSPNSWLSVGLSGHTEYIVNQERIAERDDLLVFHYSDLSLPSASDFEALPNATPETVQKSIETFTNKTLTRTTSDKQSAAIKYVNRPANSKLSGETGFGRSRFRLGIAAFPSPQLLFSFDIAGYHSRIEWIGDSQSTTQYVLNLHQGTEYFFSPRYFIRQGLFTNFDARPEQLSLKAYIERTDFIGASVFFGLQTFESQFSLGAIYQYGMGDAFKIRAIATPVSENKILLAFTAAHGL